MAHDLPTVGLSPARQHSCRLEGGATKGPRALAKAAGRPGLQNACQTRSFLKGQEVGVVFANLLHQVPVRMHAKEHARSERLRVRDRIFDGEIDLQSIRGDTVQALGDVELIRMRMPGAIEPGLVVESHGVYHESVAVPTADGI